MSSIALFDDQMREKLLANPEVILEDQDVMRALVAANESGMGENIVDLRGMAMDRLETRLDRLEDTHRNVIAAAYENLAGTNQIHRAILSMLDPTDFESFLKNVAGDVATTLRVDSIRLVLETSQAEDSPALAKVSDILSVAEPGYVDHYITNGRSVPARQVTLRQVAPNHGEIYGDKAEFIRSEATLLLDLGTGRLPGMLAMGSEDPHLFKASQGTDLLAFFAGVFERSMRRFLA
jgi:uncharacterized protein YigA (DUF484 family)